jgi:hypothetical protein
VPLVPGMEQPPHPMRLGEDEKDYYALGAAGLTNGTRAPGNAGPGGPSGPAVSAGSPDASLSWFPRQAREEARDELRQEARKADEQEPRVAEEPADQVGGEVE